MKVNFHVLYWEGGDPQSVSLRGQGAPTLCKQCGGVQRAWRFRLDNLFASIRSCGKEGGVFRKELGDFSCLSPCSAIRYDLRRFHHWLNEVNHKALTEEIVLGTAIKVDRGLLDSRDCGVHTEDLRDGQWSQWLAGYAEALQRSAAKLGGRCVTLLLDQAGVELLSLDTGAAPAARQGAPIAKVLLVLGGPSGIQPAIYKGMMEVLKKANHEVLEIRLPGGLQHSNVVIADLFMGHDRGFLLPAVEDLIHLGRRQYEEWRGAVQQHLAGLRSEAMQGAASLRQQVDRLLGAPRQPPSVRRRELNPDARWTDVLLKPQPQEQPQAQPKPPPEQQLLDLLATYPQLQVLLEEQRRLLADHAPPPPPPRRPGPTGPSAGPTRPAAWDAEPHGEDAGAAESGTECADCGALMRSGRPDTHGDWYCAECWSAFLEEPGEDLERDALAAAPPREDVGLGAGGPGVGAALVDGDCAGQQADSDGDTGDWRERECCGCGAEKLDGRTDEHGDWYCGDCWVQFAGQGPGCSSGAAIATATLAVAAKGSRGGLEAGGGWTAADAAADRDACVRVLVSLTLGEWTDAKSSVHRVTVDTNNTSATVRTTRCDGSTRMAHGRISVVEEVEGRSLIVWGDNEYFLCMAEHFGEDRDRLRFIEDGGGQAAFEWSRLPSRQPPEGDGDLLKRMTPTAARGGPGGSRQHQATYAPEPDWPHMAAPGPPAIGAPVLSTTEWPSLG